MSKQLIDKVIRQLEKARKLGEKECYEKAIKEIEKAQVSVQKTTDTQLTEQILVLKGTILSLNMDYERAVVAYGDALEKGMELAVKDQKEHRSILLDALDGLAALFTAVDGCAVLPAIEKSVAIFEAVPDDLDSINDAISALNCVGSCCVFCDEPENAIRYFEKRVAISEMLIGVDPDAYTRHYECMRDLIQVKPSGYEHAISLYKEASHDDLIVLLYSDLGNEYFNKGDGEQAKEILEKAIEVFNTISSPEVTALSGVFVAYNLLGDICGSAEYYKQAIGIYGMLQSLDFLGMDAISESIAILYGKLANIYRNDPEKARDYLLQQVDLYYDLNDQDEAGMSYGRLGDLSAEHDDPEKAMEYYEKAMDVIEYKGDLCIIYYKIANLHETSGKIQDAMEYYEKAIQMVREDIEYYLDDLECKSAFMNSLGYLASIYEDIDIGRSIELNEELLEVTKLIESEYLPLREAFLEGVLGVLHERAGTPETSPVHYDRALFLYRDMINDHPGDTAVIIMLIKSLIVTTTILIEAKNERAGRFLDLASDICNRLEDAGDLEKDIVQVRKELETL